MKCDNKNETLKFRQFIPRENTFLMDCEVERL